MKKLLLILLCLPMIFSCGKKNEEKENKCDVTPDYSMSVEDFLKMTQTSNDEFYGKIFEIKAYMTNRSYWGGMEVSTELITITPIVSFQLWGFESDYTGQLTFQLLPFTQNDEDYWKKVKSLYELNGDESISLKIKGTLDKEESEPGESFFLFINCCLVIPNQSNSTEEKSTIVIPQPKIDKIIENEIPIDTSEMKDESTYKTEEYSVTDEEEFYRGVINDPDGYTNVREEKSSKSEIVFKVYEGEEFEIIDDDGDDYWWMIKYNGKQGYMYKGRIDVIE